MSLISCQFHTIRFVHIMIFVFHLFTKLRDSGPHGPFVVVLLDFSSIVVMGWLCFVIDPVPGIYIYSILNIANTDILRFPNTVDSRYLEVEGTL